jgi:hypothetical protein
MSPNTSWSDLNQLEPSLSSTGHRASKGARHVSASQPTSGIGQGPEAKSPEKSTASPQGVSTPEKKEVSVKDVAVRYTHLSSTPFFLTFHLLLISQGAKGVGFH